MAASYDLTTSSEADLGMALIKRASSPLGNVGVSSPTVLLCLVYSRDTLADSLSMYLDSWTVSTFRYHCVKQRG